MLNYYQLKHLIFSRSTLYFFFKPTYQKMHPGYGKPVQKTIPHLLIWFISFHRSGQWEVLCKNADLKISAKFMLFLSKVVELGMARMTSQIFQIFYVSQRFSECQWKAVQVSLNKFNKTFSECFQAPAMCISFAIK